MASKVINVILGEDKNINLYFIWKDTKRPFSLVGVTEIEVRIPKASGTLVKKLSLTQLSIVGVADLGHVLVPCTETETAAWKIADGQAITAIIDIGTTKYKFNKAGVLNVAKEAVAAT